MDKSEGECKTKTETGLSAAVSVVGCVGCAQSLTCPRLCLLPDGKTGSIIHSQPIVKVNFKSFYLRKKRTT